MLAYLASLWDAEHLPSTNIVQVEDVVSLGDGPHIDPVAQRDAVQILAPGDSVIPAAGGRRGATIELARADPAGRQRARCVGDRQPLPGVDDVGVENSVLCSNGVGIYSVGPPDAE